VNAHSAVCLYAGSLVRRRHYAVTPAEAYTECQHTLLRIYACDQGYVWLYYSDGPGSVYILPSNPSLQSALAVAMTAFSTGRSVTVRYASDGVSCSNDVSRSDF
jgi:hypothetical protein